MATLSGYLVVFYGWWCGACVCICVRGGTSLGELSWWGRQSNAQRMLQDLKTTKKKKKKKKKQELGSWQSTIMTNGWKEGDGDEDDRDSATRMFTHVLNPCRVCQGTVKWYYKLRRGILGLVVYHTGTMVAAVEFLLWLTLHWLLSLDPPSFPTTSPGPSGSKNTTDACMNGGGGGDLYSVHCTVSPSENILHCRQSTVKYNLVVQSCSPDQRQRRTGPVLVRDKSFQLLAW